jgi:hypothetical protein
MEEIFRSATAVLTREPGLIRLRRTPQALGALNVAEDFVDRFRFLVPLRERRNLGFLLDSRAAPMVGDDSMFLAMRPVMVDMVVGFARVAILLQTALGILQATRRSRGNTYFGGEHVTVFGDEAQAIEYVTGRGK